MKKATFERSWIVDLTRHKDNGPAAVHQAMDTLQKFLSGIGVEVRFVTECNPITPCNHEGLKGYFEIVNWNEQK